MRLFFRPDVALLAVATSALAACGGSGNALPPASSTPAVASERVASSLSLSLSPLPTESAVPARRFVDSVGVNVHLHYGGTAYYDDYPAVKSLLVSAGIAHVRDGMIDTTWQPYYDRLNDLGAAGIHSTLTTSVGQSTALVTSYPTRVARSIEAIEGPNEYDRSGDPNWAANLVAFVKALYPAVKGAATSSSLPVIGPSLTSAQAYAAVGDLSADMDDGNMHDYFAGFAPGNGGYGGPGFGSYYGSIAYNMGAAAQTSGTKPIVATETGYATAAVRNGVTNPVEGKYVPRLFLEQFLHGVPRTFEYELLDEGGGSNGNDGLLDADLTPKPGYTALSGLLNLLTESTDTTPASLTYSIGGGTQNLHHLLLHKANGTFYIAYWLETSSFDVDAGTSGVPIAVPPQSITIAFGLPAASLKNYTYDASGNLTGTAVALVGTSVSLDATDSVSILSLQSLGSSL